MIPYVAEIEGARIVHSTEEALAAAREYPRCLVIGGASVYRQFFPWLDVVHVTKIALRRGRDRFRNGSLLQTDANGLPEFWSISNPASLQPKGVNGLPAMTVKGGSASTRW